MLVVLAALLLMATIPMVVITTTDNQLPLTTNNLNWNAAYEAAQAGLNDYTQQLDANPSYTEYNYNPSTGNNYACSTTPVNDAFCGWASSPTSTNPLATNPDEWYEYSASTYTGKVLLTVSGKAGTGVRAVVRTFTYQVAPIASLDDIYWSNDEGNNIVFDSNDVLNGPVFSNDDFYICGNPTFASTVQSADSGGVGKPYWQDTCGGSSPNFEAGVPTLASNENIIDQGTAPDVNPAKTLGCYINTTNGTGTVTITLGNGTHYNELEWSGGTLANSSGNPNTTASCGGSTGGSWVTFGTLGSALLYVNGNITINSGAEMTGYLTLVSSQSITLNGSITYPCADITWQGGGSCPSTPSTEGSDASDALGMIAEDNVVVSDNNVATTIDAAMIAVSGSFENADYQNSCGGTCNKLTVFGSIAQDTRGAVGQENHGVPSNGYAKNYLYDTALENLWPPFFIAPADATWTPRNYEECKPGASYASLGTPGC